MIPVAEHGDESIDGTDSMVDGAGFGVDADLEDRLEDALARADQAERALARAQGSFVMTVGQLVIDAGQSPRQLLALPFTLLRMRRSRRATRASRPPSIHAPVVLTPRDLSLVSSPSRVLLPRRAVTCDDRASVVMIAPAAVVDSWRGVAHVSVALPHDASALVRAIDPDVVVVHAHAGAPDSPWYPLGEPGEAVRERVLVAVRDTSLRLGRPVVLVHDPVRAPGLDPFAQGCDLVLDVTVDDTSPAAVLAAIGTLGEDERS